MANFALLLFFFFLCHLGLYSAQETEPPQGCPRFSCGKKLGELKFPFTTRNRSAHCGLLTVDGCDSDHDIKKIQLQKEGRWYEVRNIFQSNTIDIHDENFSNQLQSRDCENLNNFSLPSSPSLTFWINPNLTLFKCNHKLMTSDPSLLEYKGCTNSSIYYTRKQENLPSLPPQCSLIQLPMHRDGTNRDIFEQLTANFTLEVRVSRSCINCHYGGGDCKVDGKGNFYCANLKVKETNRRGLKLGLGLGGGIGLLALLSSLYIFRNRLKKRINSSSNFISSNSFSNMSSRSDVEDGGVYFGIPLFSYTELEKATSSFDRKKELGDGGFGTVYHGKLKDGREVAVKRLYEHNYRRVEQFMNEIEILTRLRHKNLVTLYGCTSRRSRELLLVYEYIPNGTVADHLHGDRAKSSPLTWPNRMSIAIETATALAYLHASDIIHRDVKTNNILLDNNFCVKVADFGLSRLFPTDVTHVSTAPQGTPGYVDPEYHQCYQLTDKSDVYSFGVVLVELITSMPAVDISRHRHEINLANLAVNKIQKCEFDELIDPSFGYKSDEEVKRMTILVAELAFRCLQQDKELRPSMDEVLEELQQIEHKDNPEEVRDGNNETPAHMLSQHSPTCCDEASLLKEMKMPPPSPNTVTAPWASTSSCSTTLNISS
ncbi:LEAF RUST 10 DISEASE-RESISTANCE LOCUS RECEPTOR-LIKE PROTEIN KINASE-like 1.1 isoform X3 [Mercurialis annua]|uniref:LEAF RUST 10 DISEASE-RESISTANCE LOCUS RECEPTOR-LIKE PROTEIN KINASE-like 1.1 isoform X3 n=1 Tax=Mercurialis annua TaxID=3986 RepID=UPI00215FAE8E|nr:LEAF RUST 10 DISEASE-RESISTANCE LOCUS RECEPTOR-LIKE PROTEIN KINASE-like 1.1 isoform X3 [Mercurialis annua]